MQDMRACSRKGRQNAAAVRMFWTSRRNTAEEITIDRPLEKHHFAGEATSLDPGSRVDTGT